MVHTDFRRQILTRYQASAAETAELLAYNDNVFDHSQLEWPLVLPLPPEAHVAAWQAYAQEAQAKGLFAVLQQRLVQFRFPIQAGISQTAEYQAATRRGIFPSDESGGLVLRQPEALQLVIHESLAGLIPLLITGNRDDFVTLVQALTRKNEPDAVPDAMGACVVAGFNNWSRVHEHRAVWARDHDARDWPAEFQQLILRKADYQDRFILLSDGPYSNIPARELGLADTEWQQLSLIIRREHECAHYFTRRLFGSMRNHLLDELIADYMGLVAAIGRCRADWFLRFMGLEAFPHYRPAGRLATYRGQPPLSDGAFRILQALVKDAAENLEQFDQAHRAELSSPVGQAIILITLTCFTLAEVAAQEAGDLLERKFRTLVSQVQGGG